MAISIRAKNVLKLLVPDALLEVAQGPGAVEDEVVEPLDVEISALFFFKFGANLFEVTLAHLVARRLPRIGDVAVNLGKVQKQLFSTGSINPIAIRKKSCRLA